MKAFVATVPAAAAEVAADRLWSLGVRGIEERPGAREGEIELWTVVGEEPAALAAAGALFDDWTWRVEEVDPVPTEAWREHARPVVVADRVVVAPAWHDEGSAARSGDITVRIEPGAAFGLGDHPTTRLSLGLLIETLEANAEMGRPTSVLDVGCGTGVLGITAAALGAGPVRAVDTSAAAVEATIDNARRNRVRVVADDTPLAQVDGVFDVVVANILAPTLCALAADLVRTVAPGGALIISGVLDGRYEHVLDALRPLAASRRVVDDGWAAVVLRRHGRPRRSGGGEQVVDG